MEDETGTGVAKRRYEAAYAEHYTNHNLRLAMQLYQQVIESHAGDPEQGYALAQIQNIVKEVVPPQELLEAQVKLCHLHLGVDRSATGTT